MSEQPPPYGVPYQLPRKPRPRAAWFGVGAGLIVLSIAAAVGLFLWTLSGFFETDARLPADGAPHQVTVGTDGDRMLWKDDDIFEAGCQIVDRATGDEISLLAEGGGFTRSTGSGDWVGAYRFDPGSGDLEVTCAPSSLVEADQVGEIEIGPAPQIGNFVAGLIATIAIPALLGLSGIAILLVTGILWATRPKF